MSARRLLAGLTLALLIVLYATAAGGMALRRHRHLQSQALDMGYAGQVTWNAMRGHGLRFTVFRGQVGAEEGRPLGFGPGADRDSLFAYHVELLYYPISLLYHLYAAPETLIVLLTGALALGAVPVYLIAHRLLDHRGAALAFAALYLITPSIQGANLADFHAVSLTPVVLLGALLFLLTRQDAPFLACAATAAAAKEEVGLLVAMMGLYAWLVQGRRRWGLAIATGASAWVALCFLVIIPRFSGGAPSLFAARYEDALTRIGAAPGALLAGHPTAPLPDYTLRYVLTLLAGTGFLALAGPLQLALAAPVLAINGLSGSTWQHGGGAHYSAEVVPALLLAAVFGTRHLAQAARCRGLPYRHAVLALALTGLAGGAVQSWRHGVLPHSARFPRPAQPAQPAQPDAARAARLRPLLERIPPDAPVASQSNLHPHLATRPRLYVFPATEDATYVIADVAGTSDPLSPDGLHDALSALLADPRFELLGGDSGFLLFGRRPQPLPATASAVAPAAPTALASQPPAPFFAFTRPFPDEPFRPVRAALGRPHGQPSGEPPGLPGPPGLPIEEPLFDVVGYTMAPLPEVNFGIRRARFTLFVRARRPVTETFRLTPFVVERGGLARIMDDGNPTQLWHPTNAWRAGEVVRLPYPPVAYGPGDRLGIGAQIGRDAVVPRLQVRDADRPVADGGRVLILGALP